MLTERTVQVPESWIPVFHRASLPAHPANPDTDQVIDWPRSPSGVAFMPMTGRFIVRNMVGDHACEDGFLFVDEAGEPYWQAEIPA